MSEASDIEEVLRSALEARKRGQKAEIDLRRAMLVGIDLRGADLAGADFQEADLCGADLAGAYLSRANFQGANLVGAILDGADLTGADFRGADMAGVRVDDAVLVHTRFEGACLAALLGDPLSFAGAQMDRQTVVLSQFTMRDVAQLVVRGALVNERETIPPSLAERLRSLPPSAPLAVEPASEQPATLEPASLSLSEVPGPPSAPSDARPPLSLPLSIPPASFRLSVPPSSPSSYPSILPAMRSAEISARIQMAEQDDESPRSLRVFRNLTALIESAQAEEAPPLSLQPALPRVKEMQEREFAMPRVGESYLGVRVEKKLNPGTTSQCFLGRDDDDRQVVLRVFDPGCEGAALQLPAFQRGLRALNRLQTIDDPDLRVLPLFAVAADQTAYVVPYYTGQSVKELLEVELSLEQGLEAIVSLSRTVARMHTEGAMIRSFKPENFLVEGYQLVVSEPDMVHIPTLSQYHGNVAGYGAYVAREEVLGTGTRSPSADVFGLGKMLEFLLTGQEPLIPIGSPPLISQREHVPEVLVNIVARATAEDPKERYQSVDALIADIVLFQEQGDQAVLRAELRPEAPPRLGVPAFSTGPKLPDIEELIQKQKERVKPRPEQHEDTPSGRRQVELGAALLGLLGGVATLVLLVFVAPSVDVMDRVEPFLAMAIGLSVFFLPRPSSSVWKFRLGSWAALSYAIWATHPTMMAKWTWKRHLAQGVQVQRSIAQLARVGDRDFSGAMLRGANLSGLDLATANFQGAKLQDADFHGALLLEANLSGAELAGARFSGANLFGAEISGAIGWDEAICDRYTKLPEGFRCRKGTLSFQPRAVAEGGEKDYRTR